MTAIRHVKRAVFTVPSSSGEPYLVDLSANGGNGSCTCADFKFRCKARWDASRIIKEHYEAKDATRCRHIHAALLHLGNLTAKQLSA